MKKNGRLETRFFVRCLTDPVAPFPFSSVSLPLPISFPFFLFSLSHACTSLHLKDLVIASKTAGSTLPAAGLEALAADPAVGDCSRNS